MTAARRQARRFGITGAIAYACVLVLVSFGHRHHHSDEGCCPSAAWFSGATATTRAVAGIPPNEAPCPACAWEVSASGASLMPLPLLPETPTLRAAAAPAIADPLTVSLRVLLNRGPPPA